MIFRNLKLSFYTTLKMTLSVNQTQPLPDNTNTNTNTKTKFKFKIKTPQNNSAMDVDPNPPKKISFKIKPKQSKKIPFKIKPKQPTQLQPQYNRDTQYKDFVAFCLNNQLPYFQFYDVDNWRGPATKIEQNELEHRLELFDNAQNHLHTIVLNGYGFAIVKPIENLDDSDIEYKDSYFDACKFTDEPLIPYNSDMENDSDDDVYDATTDEEIEVEEEFIAEEWTYDGVTYLLDTSTNYVYFPSTLEFIGKKTSDFSIDFNAKER